MEFYIKVTFDDLPTKSFDKLIDLEMLNPEFHRLRQIATTLRKFH